MQFETPTFDTIHQSLLRDYHSQMEAKHYEEATLDPVLGVLFRVFAKKMESLYADQRSVRLALLDELMRGLSIEPRKAIPAHAVVRFTPSSVQGAAIPEAHKIWFDGPEAQRFPFAADRAFTVSGARIGMALVYQNGFLKPCCEGQWSSAANPLYPKESVQAEWGDGISLLLALDVPGGEFPAGLSLFFDCSSRHEEIRNIMARSIWRIADAYGRFGPAGIYRPKPAQRGVMELRPAFESRTDEAGNEAESIYSRIGSGSYSGYTFVFPEDNEYPPGIDCVRPKGLDSAIGRLFPPGATAIEVLNQKRIWIRISLTPGAGMTAPPAFSSAFAQIVAHAMTFSNVECRDQTPEIGRQGSSIPLEFPGSGRYLVSLRAIHAGRTEHSVFPLLDASAPEDSYRCSVRGGRVEVLPPEPGDSAEINIRAWTTHGDSANGLTAEGMQKEIQLKDGGTIKLSAVKTPRGGRNEEDRSTAEARFASAILSRGRIVTQADLLAAVRAFDSRILGVKAKPVAVRRGGTLQTVQRISILLRSADFPHTTEADELRYLREDLERGLARRLPFDTGVEIAVEWDESHPEDAT